MFGGIEPDNDMLDFGTVAMSSRGIGIPCRWWPIHDMEFKLHGQAGSLATL